MTNLTNLRYLSSKHPPLLADTVLSFMLVHYVLSHIALWILPYALRKYPAGQTAITIHFCPSILSITTTFLALLPPVVAMPPALRPVLYLSTSNHRLFPQVFCPVQPPHRAVNGSKSAPIVPLEDFSHVRIRQF
ncbi:hypothetical protein JAAARDRAFT_550139 [Jaapia argillacea MUCL 33604]|uniref:Uncharacterized protein n=1 Tax=Jaapia argillacea MUCL 33604 TaxID=933084 RepID=A0A067PI55_9AGAM|nr:hypothetical protein JAAARDRAFT_550139 [Jaapia argillacea MUCL 33604]